MTAEIRGPRRMTFLGALMIVVACFVLPVSAQAAFPGANGKIAYRGAVSIEDGTLAGIFTITPGIPGDAFVTQGFSPAWSPDGTQLALSYEGEDRSNLDVYVRGSDHVLTRVTTDPAHDGQPAWSPDGTQLAFVSERTGTPELWVANADGSGARQLTSAGSVSARIGDPAWSPTGDQIAFTWVGGTSNEVHVIQVDGLEEHAVPLGDFNGSHPDWSPDGSRILFVSTENDFGGRLYTVKPDGSELTPLPFVGGPVGGFEGISILTAAFSPDGVKVVYGYVRCFQSRCRGGLVTGNLDGTNRTTLFESIDYAEVGDPDWQPIDRPPDCGGVVGTPSTLWPPNHKLVSVSLGGATDPDGDPLALAISGVTQDESASGSSPDAVPGRERDELALRAERDPRGDGRVYRIAFTATDSKGASCSGAVAVEVRRHPHDAAVDSRPQGAFAP